MKRILLSILFLIFISAKTYSQQGVNYDDVAVIVNMNSDSSQIIANYFKAKRNIPSVNLIPVNTSTVEEISDSLFKDYASQIRKYLKANNLGTSINYIVTTKGCPLKVLKAFRDSSGVHIPTDDSSGCNSCAESELMLLPPKDSSHMNKCLPYKNINYGFQFFTNPYYNSFENFSSLNYGIYLVTRLDGYTVKSVLNMIDRSGPNTFVNKDSVVFIFDQSPNLASLITNQQMPPTASNLLSRGWKVKLNTDSVYLTNQSNVLGYLSWGSNDGFSHHYTQNAIPHNTWAKGSIAETGVSTSGRSFQPGTKYGQSLIADLLFEGATGAKGYVYEPISIAIALPDILFDLYTLLNSDGSPSFNLAESYFAASHMIGWMDVVIGDPKTSITTNPALASVVSTSRNVTFQVFPNPSSENIFVSVTLKNPEIVNMFLFDLTGREVWKGSADSTYLMNKEINVSSLPSGIYTFQLRTTNQVISRRVAIIR